MPGNESIAKSLGYAGLIPFIVFSIGSWISLPIVTNSAFILTAYAAIILSFMGAIHWGAAMTRTDKKSSKYFIASVIPALTAWLALLLPEHDAIILLLIGFIALILYEWSVEKTMSLPNWYMPMRNRLTLIVILCLTVTLLSY